jgi:hypothetical protein
MKSVCRLFSILLPSALLASAAAVQAQNNGSWDGAWTGLLNNRARVVVTIAHDKVVGYTLAGAPFTIQYSALTPTSVSFGDRDHYAVEITRTGDATATESAHGRLGFATAALTKE